jgi:hypothetical protein
VGASKKFDGSWDGNIGDKTKKAIEYVKAGLVPDYVGNTISDLSKRLEKEINDAVNESVNYFKGDNIQVSLSRLFEQALKEGFDKDKADAWAAADAATKEPTAVPIPPATPTLKDKAAVDTKPKSAKIVDKLVRQENGFLTTTNLYKRMKKGGTKNFPTNSSGVASELKKLLYNKNIIVRSGIGKYRDNDWRGYNDVSRDWLTGFDGKISGGTGYRNWSNTHYKNIKSGTKIDAKILDVKYIMGGYWAQPEPRIWTYVYAKSGNGATFWVPTTWIEIP